jgi:hypothetical protein
MRKTCKVLLQLAKSNIEKEAIIVSEFQINKSYGLTHTLTP